MYDGLCVNSRYTNPVSAWLGCSVVISPFSSGRSIMSAYQPVRSSRLRSQANVRPGTTASHNTSPASVAARTRQHRFHAKYATNNSGVTLHATASARVKPASVSSRRRNASRHATKRNRMKMFTLLCDRSPSKGGRQRTIAAPRARSRRRGEGKDEEPNPPAPFPSGKGVTDEVASCATDKGDGLEMSSSPLPFREGGLGGVG